jgi:hypothetical protein
MDLAAHALYAATVCSRTGLAGGRTGAPCRRWYRDGTVWWAVAFGLLPDVLSMWVPFAVHVISGQPGNFFHHFGGDWLTVYRTVHSLVIALAVSAALLAWRRSLFIPSLAWAVHVLLDAVSHGQGKYQTLLFYPLTSWGIDGIAWWRTPWFFVAYWAVLPVTWLTLVLVRRVRR